MGTEKKERKIVWEIVKPLKNEKEGLDIDRTKTFSRMNKVKKIYKIRKQIFEYIVRDGQQ